MPVDLELLGSKLRKYRQQFEASLQEVAEATGIRADRLSALEEGVLSPTGDEILVISDYYKCDYNEFLSGDHPAVFEETEELYRIHGDEFSKEDRWAVQEFLFLCVCEDFLLQALDRLPRKQFTPTRRGGLHKKQGVAASAELRSFLGYGPEEVRADIYGDFRTIGIHVFRRKLANSNISGIFIKHPIAGKSVLVNYDEDVYRQRFTVAHEAAHAILDDDKDFIVSFSGTGHDLREVRANYFASGYLLPRSVLQRLLEPSKWDASTVRQWANKLQVNCQPLAIALKEANLISESGKTRISAVKLPTASKVDPELPPSLAPRSMERRKQMLRRGLSAFYVSLCFDAYERGVVSAGRLAEMLLCDEGELAEFAGLYGRRLQHGD